MPMFCPIIAVNLIFRSPIIVLYRILKIESRLDAVVRGRSYYYSIGAENPLGLGPAAGQAKAVEPDKPGKVNDAPWVDRGGALILFLVIFVNSHVRSFKER